MAQISADGVPWMRSPIRLGGDKIDLQPAPRHGEHTREVLLAHDFSETEIAALLESGDES